jgi:O-antigen ligase
MSSTLQASSRWPSVISILLPLAVGLLWVAILFLGPGRPALHLAPLVIVIAAIAAMVFAAASLGRPWAFMAILAFMIFGLSLSFREREPGEVGLDLQNGVKLFVWAALVGVAILNIRRLAPMMREPVVALAFVYAGFALASAAWSLTPTYSGAVAIGWVGNLALACLAVRTCGERAVMVLLVWSIGAFVAVGLAGLVFAPDIAWMPPSVEETEYRFRGFSGHPNVLAQQAGVLVTVAVVARRARYISRRLFVAALALGFATLVLTDSRTAMIAVIVAWGFVALRERGLGRLAVIAAVAVLVLVLTVFTVGGVTNIEDALGMFSRTGAGSEVLTLTGRTEIWTIAWERILQRPLLGWGYLATEELLLSSVGRTFYGDAINAHNMFVQSLLSVGFLGSLAGFAMIGLLVVRLFSRPDPVRDHVVVFMLISGMGEVEIFATPMLLTVSVFIILAREAERNAVIDRQRTETRYAV